MSKKPIELSYDEVAKIIKNLEKIPVENWEAKEDDLLTNDKGMKFIIETDYIDIWGFSGHYHLRIIDGENEFISQGCKNQHLDFYLTDYERAVSLLLKPIVKKIKDYIAKIETEKKITEEKQRLEKENEIRKRLLKKLL